MDFDTTLITMYGYGLALADLFGGTRHADDRGNSKFSCNDGPV